MDMVIEVPSGTHLVADTHEKSDAYSLPWVTVWECSNANWSPLANVPSFGRLIIEGVL